VFGHIKAYYGCYEIAKNGSLHIHTLLFDNDVSKLMNICNCHVCNLACYESNIDASKKLCRYGFPQPLINTTHIDNDVGLLQIKRIHKWFNNANPWILFISKCNHDLNL
jgi:hypothetical protein